MVRRTCRSYSHSTSLQIEQLHKRALIKLSGGEIYNFLQGLVTNDMNILNGDGQALFTFFLNNKGRVMYDSLIYRKTDQELLLECDSTIRDDLVKHLKMYRVRKKIDIVPVNENVWVVFNEKDLVNDPLNCTIKKADRFSFCNAPILKGDSEYEKLFAKNSQEDFAMFTDPRIYLLGGRIYGSSLGNITKSFFNRGIDVTVSKDYTKFRYKLGVAEGVTELPPGQSFPLEANCDYLRGVSFHKGCYVGQELTARTHHTGVVRKRMMPLILSSVPECELTQESIIETEDGKKVGKLRGISNKYAIALLRITESLQNATKLKVYNVSAFTYKPYWWPQEHTAQSDLSSS